MPLIDYLLDNSSEYQPNKLQEPEKDLEEGIHGELEEELTLKKDDKEILKITKEWANKYERYEKDIEKKQKVCENYWLGKQNHQAFLKTEESNYVNNLIFEALETFLPQATRANPEPYIYEEGGDQDNIPFAKKVKHELGDIADKQVLRLKIKKATRFWSLYFLGVMKVGYSENGVTLSSIRPQNLILDPDATIEEGVYRGQYIGERITMTAQELTERFPNKASAIKEKVKDKMATSVVYTEWWNGEELYFTFEKIVLGKFKNPHYNYEGENHFNRPQNPYSFLTVFNLGKQPHDETSLIYQNISQQNLINKRLRQIDMNADRQNNGIAVSGDYFDKEQASQAAETVAEGGYLWQPSGDVRAGVQQLQAPSLTADIFNQLVDMRRELKNIFGISGLTPEGIQQDRTVSGKIISQQVDTSRIGGGVTEYIEQMADRVYNLMYQMILVYEPEKFDAFETVPVIISVKEGTLIPKDDLTKRNEAIDLWNAGALDPLSLAERLEIGDPEEFVQRLITWQSNPGSLLQSEEGGQQMLPQPEQQPVEQPLPVNQV